MLGFVHQQGALFLARRELKGAGDPHHQGAQHQQRHLSRSGAQGNGDRSEGAAAHQPLLGQRQDPLTAEAVGEHPGRAAHQQAG